MSAAPPLLSFLLLMIAGWVHRHQLLVIEFLQAENRLLKNGCEASESGSRMQSARYSGAKRKP